MAVLPLVLVTWFAALLGRFIAQMKVAHVEIWQSMGSPELIHMGSLLRPPLRLYWYLLSRNYKRVDDPTLTKYGNSASLALWLFFSLCLIFALVGKLRDAI